MLQRKTSFISVPLEIVRMSKQSAIAAAFAVFAMASFALSVTPDRLGGTSGTGPLPVQAELFELDLPKPALPFPN